MKKEIKESRLVGISVPSPRDLARILVEERGCLQEHPSVLLLNAIKSTLTSGDMYGVYGHFVRPADYEEVRERLFSAGWAVVEFSFDDELGRLYWFVAPAGFEPTQKWPYCGMQRKCGKGVVRCVQWDAKYKSITVDIDEGVRGKRTYLMLGTTFSLYMELASADNLTKRYNVLLAEEYFAVLLAIDQIQVEDAHSRAHGNLSAPKEVSDES